MAELHLPRSLADLFPGAPRSLEAEAGDVRAVLAHLDQQWPGMWDRLCTAGPAIREHINIFVDGEKATLSTPVRPNSMVRIIPAVPGG